MNPNAADAHRLVRDNFAEKAAYVARSLPTMRVWEGESYVAVDCGFPSDTFNVIVARHLTAPTQLLDEAVAPFIAKRCPLALWYWEDPVDLENRGALTAYGLTHAETHAAMCAELAEVNPSAPQPEGLELRPAQTARELRAHGAVIAALFGDAAEGRQVATYYDLLSTYGLETFPALRPYIGLYRGVVAAAGTLFVGQGSVGIYDVVTRAEVRKRGIGSAMFAHLLREAKPFGKRYAVLQASPDGLGLYARAGFKTTGTVHTFENRALLEAI